jgi:hypothetical protein
MIKVQETRLILYEHDNDDDDDDIIHKQIFRTLVFGEQTCLAKE